MTRKGALVAAAVVIFFNLATLAAVWVNRSGEPEAVLQLTERELSLPPREAENTALALQLEWVDTELLRPGPGWFDKRKLEEIGFDCSVPLTPGRSIAVDPAVTALGLPVWLDTTEPQTNAPLRRLVVAQDKGSAIKGPGRIDLFWGAGEQAEAMAGPMRQQGTYWVIVPRAVGERWLQQQAGS